MSVQRECKFVTIKETKDVYLMIAWREHGRLEDGELDVVGPFTSVKVATEYLYSNYSNPGGEDLVTINATGKDHPLLRKLIKRATTPVSRFVWW